MASKRHHTIDYAEDSYTDDDDELDQEQQDEQPQQQQQDENRPRGRPRKNSHAASSSVDNTSNNPEISLPSVTRKKGRGPSKRPCLNRNALMARENRQRKKEYIEKIESRLQAYQKENMELNSTIKQQNNEIKKLTNEVSYLKSVLNNKSRISTLLQAMNESLRRMHGNENTNSPPAATTAANDSTYPVVTTNGNGFGKSSVDVLSWVSSGQTSTTNNMPASGLTNNCSEVLQNDDERQVCEQMNNPIRVARKTMPLNSFALSKTENPSSIDSTEEDEKALILKSSPNSSTFCEYQTDRSSAGHDNQFPATPMSAWSNSLKNEASLSDTDFSQLSSFNVDLFDNMETEVANPLQFDQDTPDLFNDETLFHTIDKESGILNNDIIEPLELSKMSEILNEKTLFNSLENTGVCLHINSNRVSLEYCSICHMNSLNSEYL